jgi:hypothetical protein
MENKRGQIAVVSTLVIICIVLILILIVMLWSFPTSKVIYEDNYVNRVSYSRNCEVVKVPYTVKETYYDSVRNYEIVWSDYERNYRNSGVYRNRYMVRIKNIGEGGWFEVKFYLYDDGERIVKTVRKYLHKGETQTFSQPDYSYDSYNWNYKVIADNSPQRERVRYVTKYKYVEKCY